jgi:hypothetical protein
VTPNCDAERIAVLEAQVAELRRQLHYANERNHERNLQLDALNFVWCDGGCPSGTRRWQDDELTADQAEAYAKELALMAVRLHSWGAAKRFREKWRNEAAEADRLRAVVDT